MRARRARKSRRLHPLPSALPSPLTRFACAAPLARRGYGSKYRAIKSEIEKAFPGQTAVTGEATPGATGFLEVQVVGGALLHSKKNGQGYVDTAAKMQAMCVSRSRGRGVGCNAPRALQPPRHALVGHRALGADARAPRPRSLDGVKTALA